MSPVKEPFIDEEGIALGYDEPYGRAERVRQLHVRRCLFSIGLVGDSRLIIDVEEHKGLGRRDAPI